MHPSSTPSPAPPPPPESRVAFVVPGTVFPHALTAEVMPTLSGAQWQLLTVIVRQTLGWYDPATGGRKRQDWLSHRQLRARTGRGSEAVSHAVDALVQRQLIEVRDEGGRTLGTAAQRRRASRLYFSLSASLLESLQAPRPEPQLPAGPKTSSPAMRETRFRKAETTKESLTKDMTSRFGKAEWNGGETALPFQDELPAVPSDPDPEALRAELSMRTPHTSEPLAPELRPFLQAYQEKLRHFQPVRGEAEEVFSDGFSYEDQARLQAALDSHGPEQLERMAEAFLGRDSPLLHYRGYGLGAFLEVLPILAILRLKPAAPANVEVFGLEHRAAGGAPHRGE